MHYTLYTISVMYIDQFVRSNDYVFVVEVGNHSGDCDSNFSYDDCKISQSINIDATTNTNNFGLNQRGATPISTRCNRMNYRRSIIEMYASLSKSARIRNHSLLPSDAIDAGTNGRTYATANRNALPTFFLLP